MTALEEKIAGRRVVASVSSGKDSGALSLFLRDLGIEHDRVFMDTGWEHPATYEYLRGPLTAALGPITEIRARLPNGEPLTLPNLIRSRKGFPGGRTRFCTTELKLKPMVAHLAALMDSGVDVLNAVGIRRDESLERVDAAEWEWSELMDCETWRPLVTWTIDDVIALHKRHGLKPNPLYMMGFDRVGCFPCINANKGEIRLVADMAPERVAEIAALEEEIAIVSNADPKPSFFYLRDLGGKKERAPIADVVAWARTARGGSQFDMFPEDRAEAGCMRWGLCDTGSDS